MAFFETPGYSVGPFHVQAKPGVFDRIIQGVGAVASIADMVGKFQERRAQKEKGQLGVESEKINMARALQPDQPLTLDEATGQKIEKLTGFKLPKVTDKDRQQTLSQIIASGGATVPGRELTDPALAEAQAPPLGAYAPLPVPAPKTLEQAMLKNMQKSGQATGENLLSLYQQIHGKQQRPLHVPGVGVVDWQGNVIKPEPEPTTTLYDMASGKTTTIPGKNVKAVHPWVSPIDVATTRENLIRNRPTTYVTPGESGEPAGATTYKGRVHFGPQKGTAGVTFITPEEARGNPGKQWPKGTRVINDKDPAWNAAQAQANRVVSADPLSAGKPPGEVAQRQAEVAKSIYTESQKAQGEATGRTPAVSQSKGGTMQFNLKTPDGIEAAYQDAIKRGKDPEQAKALKEQLLQGIQ